MSNSIKMWGILIALTGVSPYVTASDQEPSFQIYTTQESQHYDHIKYPEKDEADTDTESDC